jgi:hypothetical protein
MLEYAAKKKGGITMVEFIVMLVARQAWLNNKNMILSNLLN